MKTEGVATRLAQVQHEVEAWNRDSSYADHHLRSDLRIMAGGDTVLLVLWHDRQIIRFPRAIDWQNWTHALSRMDPVNIDRFLESSWPVKLYMPGPA